ncbi:hypothetical protein JVU11DRAFT_2769 [Chiua virens]|nr:hypothetical protein JVU11DRAFT_2769 [Chiua virens]
MPNHSAHSVDVSSRESSPPSKRQRRSFSPASDDGDLVASVSHNEDAETPTFENTPLIRQAVGFSSLNTDVSTYQAAVDTQPTVSYFLPGQAPPAPQKPKVPKPRAPRKKKGDQYSDRTNKFRLTASSATTLTNSSRP